MSTEVLLAPAPSHSQARTGGYALCGDECWSFRAASCREDAGQLTLEADGDGCSLELPRVLSQSRSGCVEDLLGLEQPFHPGQFDWESLAESSLILGGRCLTVLGVRAAFTEYDPDRGLLVAEVAVTAESADGTYRDEFEVWLACEYRAGRLP